MTVASFGLGLAIAGLFLLVATSFYMTKASDEDASGHDDDWLCPEYLWVGCGLIAGTALTVVGTAVGAVGFFWGI